MCGCQGGVHGGIGGMHGCRGCVWLLGGQHVWWPGGACVVARGACVVARGHAWLGGAWLPGGMRGIRRDTVNERAVRILLECILVVQNFALVWSLSFTED